MKAILFDAYGTLFDTGDGSVQATRAILRRRNCRIEPREFYRTWKTLHREHITTLGSFVREEEIFLWDLHALYGKFGIDGDPADDVKLMLATLGTRTTFPETHSVLAALRERYRLYIASTSDHGPLVSDIKQNAVAVDGSFTSESLLVYKPRREFFDRILHEIQLPPEEAIYVGDSQEDDVLGAKSAGLKVVWVNRSRKALQAEIPEPDFEVHDLTGLLRIL